MSLSSWLTPCIALIATLTLAACDSETAPGAPKVEPSLSVTAPPLRACYRLVVADGLQISNDASPVACSKRHTAVTVALGKIRKASDGRPLTMYSAAAQRQIASACKAKVDAHVGGSRETRRLSRVQAVWFSPTRAQSKAGARWFRCDLVVARNQNNFAVLPKKTLGLLDQPGARRYGTCASASPGSPRFRRVACAQPHSWRARASIDLPEGTRYLGAAAGKRADDACRDIEARRDATATRLRWSFEWPTKAQWRNGQRYGLCWTPDP